MTQYLNLQTNELTTEAQIRAANPNTSYPDIFPIPDGYAIVFDTPQPTYDSYTQSITQGTPVNTGKGHYEQSWVVADLTGDALTAAQDRKQYDLDQKRAGMEITMRQCRLALLEMGLYDAVNAHMATMPQAAQIEWDYSATVKRSNPLIAAMAQALGMTETNIDTFFALGQGL